MCVNTVQTEKMKFINKNKGFNNISPCNLTYVVNHTLSVSLLNPAFDKITIEEIQLYLQPANDLVSV
jgi:hypothetical protein